MLVKSLFAFTLLVLAQCTNNRPSPHDQKSKYDFLDKLVIVDTLRLPNFKADLYLYREKSYSHPWNYGLIKIDSTDEVVLIPAKNLYLSLKGNNVWRSTYDFNFTDLERFLNNDYQYANINKYADDFKILFDAYISMLYNFKYERLDSPRINELTSNEIIDISPSRNELNILKYDYFYDVILVMTPKIIQRDINKNYSESNFVVVKHLSNK